ncbi:unnamed protein product, partial [marine sediment metagenome]
GKVITVDSNFSIVQAVAVKDAKIVAVGTDEEVRALVGKDTKVLDLKGKTMLPGINDAHIHLSVMGTRRPPLALDVGYPTVRSINEIAEMVGEKVKAVQPGEWIRGSGWDEAYLEECLRGPARHPTRWGLDAVSPDNPVCLTHFSMHDAWVNSKALELAKITKDTPNPKGGEIVRDPNTAEPTGILKELSASNLVKVVIPPFTKEQQRQAIILAMNELISLGITSITDPFCTPEVISLYNDLYNEGKLPLRVNMLLVAGDVETDMGQNTLKAMQETLAKVGTHTGFGNEWLRISGYKILSDGIPGSKTAWMYDEYIGGGCGALVISGETDEERYNQLINMIVYAHKRGFQVAVHACGDRAVDACVGGFIKAMQEEPWDARHYIIHAQNLRTPECAKRLAEHNIGVNTQSVVKWTISDYIDDIIGKERSAREWPVRTLIDAGVHVSNSSDCPVAHPNWKQGVEAAILRESKATGKVCGPEQCITVEEAIRTFTIEGAWQDHMENVKGSIDVGKLADFCVLGED